MTRFTHKSPGLPFLKLNMYGGETLEAITKYMIAKEKAAVPESRCSTFGRHMSNELEMIKNVSIQKRVQLDIMKLVFDAQVEDGAI